VKARSSKSTFLRRFRSVGVLGCAIFGAVLTTRADYLYWTLDFDNPQATAEIGLLPKDNPTSNNAYVWLTAYTCQTDGNGNLVKDSNGYVFTKRQVINWAVDDDGQYSVEGQHLDTTGKPNGGGGLGEYDGGGRTAWNIVDLSGFDADVVFAVEMGATYGEVDYFSVQYTAAQLEAMGYTKDIIGTMEAPWNPAVGTWSVPEPSSGLLMLLGGALMALRRRWRA